MKSCSIKSIILAGLVILSSVLFWALLERVFEIPLALSVLLGPAISLLVFGTLVGLFHFLVDKKLIVFLALAISTLTFFIFFGFHFVYLIGLVLFYFGLAGAYHRIHSDKESRIRISFRRSVTRGLGLILTVAVMMIALVYYFNSPLIKADKEIEVPQWIISSIAVPVSKMMPELNEQLISQKEELKKQFGIEIKESKGVSQIVEKTINAKINEFVGPYRTYISIGVAFGLFLLLRIIMIPFSWLVFILAWILFKILTALKIVRLGKVQKEVEVVSF